MRRADKFYEESSEDNKQAIFALMDENCPSDFGMKDDCDSVMPNCTEHPDCYMCWMREVE